MGGRNLTAIVVAAAALVGGPAWAQGPRHVVGAFMSFDLLTEDPAAAQEFYTRMFGWTYRSDGEVVTVVNNGREIGTIRAHDTNADEGEAQWIGRMTVDDVAEATVTLAANGGRVFVGPARTGNGDISVVADPQGAVLSLYRSDEGDLVPETLDHGDWFWPELWTTDAAAAVKFYTEIGGFEARPVDDRYTVMRHGGIALAGIGQAPFEVDAHWLPGVLVADIGEAQRAVAQLGGTVLIEASEQFGGGAAAVVLDPTGAAFMIQVWTGDTEDGR